MIPQSIDYYRLNLLLAILFLLVNIFLFFGLPQLLHLHEAYIWLAVPLVILTTSYWSIIHETIHGTLHQNQLLNNFTGRILCIFFPAPWQVLRLGHLLHHRFNRCRHDQTEVFSKRDSVFIIKLRFYFRLLIGLYLVEMFSLILVFMPAGYLDALLDLQFDDDLEGSKIKHLMRQLLLESHHLQQARFDSALSLLILYGSVILYKEYLWLLLVILAGRGVMISLFDNAYHYATPLYQRHAAHNLQTNRCWQWLILNFNLHRVHHRYPGLPWFQLAQRFTRDRENYTGNYLAIAFRQFQGPRFGE